jgi:putative ABC transport system permease protein
VAVISYACWQRQYGGNPDAVGSHLPVDRVEFAIIGITPAAFTGVDRGTDVDVIVPIGTQPLIRGENGNLLNVRATS